MYSFSYLEPACCSMSSSNCFFLTCIHIFQEADQVVWYSHPFKNFPQFIVIHTVKGFGIVSKAKVDDFMELSCFFDDPADVSSFHGVVQLSPLFQNIFIILERNLVPFSCHSPVFPLFQPLSEVAQLYPTLFDPMDYSLPCSSCSWNFPGKSTGLGCHFLLQSIFPT